MRKILLSAVAVAALGYSGAAQAQIKIGVAGPLTGSNAAFGTQLQVGADQAVADINAKGGVLGKKLVDVVADDACDPKQAVTVANQLVEDGVVFVDGHFCSASSIPASKVYSDNGILEMSPASTNPNYTDDSGSKTVFRDCGRDDQQGKVAADYIAKNFKNAKIAVLDDNSTYGKGIADQVRMNLKKLGIPDAYDASYTAGDKDYSALISRLKQAGITLVYIGGYYSDAGLIERQGQAQGFTPQYFGEDAMQASALWQVAGPAAQGMLFTFPRRLKKAPAAPRVHRLHHTTPAQRVFCREHGRTIQKTSPDRAHRGGIGDDQSGAGPLCIVFRHQRVRRAVRLRPHARHRQHGDAVFQ